MENVEVQEVANQEGEKRNEFVKTLMGALAKFPNTPAEAEVAGWKEEHGEVYASGMSDDEIFIWRPLTRVEHKTILSALRDAEMATQKPADESELKEKVVRVCLLWASRPDSVEKKGGTVETLFEQIMANSNFMDPRVAAQLVFKL